MLSFMILVTSIWQSFKINKQKNEAKLLETTFKYQNKCKSSSVTWIVNVMGFSILMPFNLFFKRN